jgi:hypothetical protein
MFSIAENVVPRLVPPFFLLFPFTDFHLGHGLGAEVVHPHQV